MTLTYSVTASLFGVLPVGYTTSSSGGTSNQTSNSTAFQESFTDATAFGNESLSSNPDAVNHHYDKFLIWVNPEISVNSIGATPISYTVAPTTGTIVPSTAIIQTAQPLFAEAEAIEMEAAPAGVTVDNPTGAAGVTTIPVSTLAPEIVLNDTSPASATIYPGLAAVCASTTLYQQQVAADEAAITANPTNPTPTEVCTQGNQCGCVPADFSNILLQDPLLNYNIYTYTANPYSGMADPLALDVAGVTACGTPNSTTDCRYVPVPATQSTAANPVSTPQLVQLWGSGCITCGDGPDTFTASDAFTETQTLGGQVQQTVGASVTYKVGAFSLTKANQMTYVQSESTGVINGNSSSMSVVLNTNNANCKEPVNIFEDTVYHTFVFQESGDPATDGCTSAP
jgi:hypothetical protein